MSISRKCVAFGTLAFALIGFGTAQARAGLTAGVTFDAPTVDYTNNTWSLGYQFVANANETVSALGYYYNPANGWNDASHDVGIYDASGNLLTSTTVTAGNSTYSDYFRYTSTASIQLQAGQTYYIAATTGSDNYTWDPVNPVFHGITFVQDQYVVSTTLAFPSDGPSGYTGYFGPNLYLSAVPEPSSVALAGLGALGVVGFARRRRSS